MSGAATAWEIRPQLMVKEIRTQFAVVIESYVPLIRASSRRQEVPLAASRATSTTLSPRAFLSKPFIPVQPPNQQSSASPQSQDLPPGKPNNNPDRDVYQRRQQSESPPCVLGYIPCAEIDRGRCGAIMSQRRVEVGERRQ